MGFSKKSQAEGTLEPESKKWVIAGISIRACLKPISTKPRHKDRRIIESNIQDEEEQTEAEAEPTTPTGREARIADRMPCPAAPRKRRPPLRCHVSGGREFFNHPDLEAVFKLGHVERAN